MRKSVYILMLTLLYILFTAKSCDNQQEAVAVREDSLASAVKDSITSAFASDDLSNQTLKAFEATARLKINDFRDYLMLLSDSTTSDVFKTKVAEMIGELFISREVHLDLSCHGMVNENKNLVRQMHHAGFKNIDIPEGVLFDSVVVLRPLQKLSDTLYSGELGTRIHYIRSAATGNKMLCSVDKVVQVYLVKHEKFFGNHSLKVWSILLGDIR
jgi:hypothetical protein